MRRIMTAATATMFLGGLAAVPIGAVPASAEFIRETRISDAPRNVTLGDRIRVTVKVGSPARARAVQLERRTTDIYGNTIWSKVSRQRVNGRAKHTFKPVAAQLDRERFRAVTTYKSGGRASSTARTLKVWSWTPLSKLPSYYRTNGINGLRTATSEWLGINTWVGSPTAAMEPGRTDTPPVGTARHCAVTSDSTTSPQTDRADEFIIVNVDDGSTLYQSPVVHPGGVVSAQVRLPLPYRISIQVRTTPADGPLALPAIGSPELLCIDLGK